MMKTSVSACRTNSSLQFRIVGAPCVSMSIKPSTPLFKILDLLANFLQLRLAGDNALRNSGIVGLGAEGIEFPKNFLDDEFKRPADRLVFAQMMRELREMTFQPRQFL